MITLPSASLPWRSLLHSSVARETPSVNWWSKLHQPLRGLGTLPLQGARASPCKGRTAPNATQSGRCPNTLQGTYPLTHIPPALKGAQGWAAAHPGNKRVGSLSVKGRASPWRLTAPLTLFRLVAPSCPSLRVVGWSLPVLQVWFDTVLASSYDILLYVLFGALSILDRFVLSLYL